MSSPKFLFHHADDGLRPVRRHSAQDRHGTDGFLRYSGIMGVPCESRLWLLVPIGLAILFFGPSLQAPFLGDDYSLILRVQGADGADLSRVLQAAVTPLPDDAGTRFWRPLWMLSFWADHVVWGVQAVGFHLTNLLLHLGCVALLYRVAVGLTLSTVTALGAAALFAVFPTHHEAVPWIAARGGPMALLFTLAAVALTLDRPTNARRAGAALAVALALLSKEIGILAAPLCLLALVCSTGSGGVRAAWQRTRWLFAISVAYALGRVFILGVFAGGYADLGVTPFGGRFWVFRLHTLATLFGPAKTSLVGLAAAAVVGCVVVSVLVGGLIKGRALWRQMGFALGWLLVTFVPIYEFVVPVATQENARYLYAPAAALCLALAIASEVLQRFWSRAQVGILGVLVVVYGALLAGNLSARHTAEQTAAALFPAVAELATSGQPSITVLWNVPDHVGFAYVGRNAFPSALHPIWVGEVLQSPIYVLLDDDLGKIVLGRLRRRLAGDDRALFMKWNGDSRVFEVD
jgi:hypothetical protein